MSVGVMKNTQTKKCFGRAPRAEPKKKNIF
jgi:hypothetical protein